MAVSVGEIEATLKLRDELSGELQKAEKAIQVMGVSADKTSDVLDLLGKSIKELGDAGAISQAAFMAEAIGDIGNVAKLTRQEQIALNAVVKEAIAQYAQLGQKAPADIKAIEEATNHWVKAEQGAFVEIKKVDDLVKNFGGGDAIKRANELAAAVEKMGGASKLTAADQQRVNQAVNEALAHYKALGTAAPQHLLAIEQATRKLEEPTKSVATFGQQLKAQFLGLGDQIGKTAASFALGLVSVQALQQGFRILSDFVQSSVKSFLDSEAAMHKIDAALRTVGQFTPRLAAQYKDLAESMESVTVNSDDLQAESIALFSTIGNVGPESMEKVLAAANDLSAGLGIDLVQASTLVAKTLSGETNALKRYGIEVEDSASKGERLTAVLQGIAREFGGRAAEEIKTSAGAIKQLGNAWDNFKEIIGGAIVQSPAFILFLNTTNAALQQQKKDLDEATKSFDEYLVRAHDRGVKSPNAKDVNLPTDVLPDPQRIGQLTDALKNAQAALSLLSQAKREDIRAGVDLGRSTEEIAKKTGISADIIELYKDRLQDSKKAATEAAREQKKVQEAFDAVADSMKPLTELQKANVKSLLDRKVAEKDIAIVLGISVEQIKKMVDSEKELADIRKIADKQARDSFLAEQKLQDLRSDKALKDLLTATGKNADQLIKVEDEYFKSHHERGKNQLQIDIENAERWAEEQRLALDATGKNYDETLTMIDLVVNEKMADARDAHNARLAEMAAAVNSWGNVVQRIFNDVPNLIKQAFTGGGGLKGALSAITSNIGGNVVGKLFEGNFQNVVAQGFKKIFGVGAAAALANVIPGIGQVIGSLAGPLIQAISNIGKNVTKGGREDFAKKLGFGDLGKLYDDLNRIGKKGQELANIGLNVIGRKDEAANRKWMADVEKFYQMIEQEAAKVEEAIGRTDITWSKEMQEFINKTPAFGEAIKKQLSSAASGLTTFLSKGADATKSVQDIKKQIADLDGNEITGIGEKWAELNKQLQTQEGILDAIGIKSQGTAEAFGASIAGIFGSLQQQGVDVVDALKLVEPAVSSLQTQLEATGFSGGAAFDSIKAAIDLVKDPIAGPVLEAVNGLDEALTGLNNTGLLNQSTFSALSGQISQAFDSLVAQGKDGDQVLRLMQKPLQEVWELQQDFGFAVDDSTQKLLDQASKAGIVGDKFRDPMERMIKAMDHMVEILEKIAIKFGAIPDDAANAAAGVDDAFKDKEIEVPVKFKWGKFEPPPGGEFQPPGFAEGTHGQFLDFGKGTLAMLHGREAVVPQGESIGNSSTSGTMQPIIINVDGLKLLEIMAKLADRHGATMPLMYR